ncbi:MAG: single-stranded DNA-binding protein [Christensenellaceae bacterium]|jgi:primosomal replication protein N|nr:single-stranded DNA-binding protein [Christensenellaceae bacterium]
METQTGNSVWIYGTISEVVGWTTDFEERGYCCKISVRRLSSSTDTLQLVFPESLMQEQTVKPGEEVGVYGQFRSCNKIENGRSRLVLYVYAQTMTKDIDEDNPNVIELSGYICKPPIYRLTPFNREITDLLIASNRADGKSDYLPAIAWGRNAHITQRMKVGDEIKICGRIQSREYQKRIADGETETRTAYEISVSRVLGCADDARLPEMSLGE